MFPPSVLLNFRLGITLPRAFWMLSNERLAWNCKISHLPIKNVTSCIRWNTVTIEMNSSGRELASPAWTFFQSTAGLRHSTSKELCDLVWRKTAWLSRRKEACGFVSLLKFWRFWRVTWISNSLFLYHLFKAPPCHRKKWNRKVNKSLVSHTLRWHVQMAPPQCWALLINLHLQSWNTLSST